MGQRRGGGGRARALKQCRWLRAGHMPVAMGTAARLLLLHVAHGGHAQREGWGSDAEVSQCPGLSSFARTWSPKASLLLLRVVKEEKSLVLPWAREV